LDGIRGEEFAASKSGNPLTFCNAASQRRESDIFLAEPGVAL
jgi:hypothetical protein